MRSEFGRWGGPPVRLEGAASVRAPEGYLLYIIITRYYYALCIIIIIIISIRKKKYHFDVLNRQLRVLLALTRQHQEFVYIVIDDIGHSRNALETFFEFLTW